jgi:hypothetical protein
MGSEQAVAPPPPGATPPSTLSSRTTAKPPPPPPASSSSPSRSLAYLRARTAVVATVSLLAALVGLLSPSARDLSPPATEAGLFPRALLDRSPLDGRVFSPELGAYAFGRWRQPVDRLLFHSDADDGAAAALGSLLRTKAWHYSSVNSDQFFIGMAIVKARGGAGWLDRVGEGVILILECMLQLGYLNDAFVYVVDKHAADADKFEFSGRFPGSVGLTFASSSVDDAVPHHDVRSVLSRQ